MKESAPPEVYFDEQPLFYDRSTQRFLVSLIPDGTKNPSVRTVSSLFRQYEIAILGNLFDSFPPTNKGARLLVYNQHEYKEFLLESTLLPVISIQMEVPGDADYPVGMEDEQAKITVFDNRNGIPVEDRTLDARMFIRLRGASSMEFAKRQYRLNLRKFSIGGTADILHLNLLGLREDDDWILASPYNDPHKIREMFAYSLWYESMSDNNPYQIRNGTEPRFVELFIDEDYRGLYLLLYPIDDKQLGLKTSSSAKSDFYYRGIDLTPFSADDFTSFDPTEIRGRFELRAPKPTGDPEQWLPLVEYMSALEQAPEEQKEYLTKHTYLPNQIDYYLFKIFLQANDNDEKNHNYIAYWDDDRHVFLESPWDMDLTMGLIWHSGYPRNSFWGGNPNSNPQPRTSFITRAIENNDREIIEAVKKRWQDLRSNPWSEENLSQKIDEYETLIYGSGAAIRDRQRWPYAAYTTNLDGFREYVLHRLQSMDTFIEDLGGE